MRAVPAAERCDAIYRARLAAGEPGWHDAATAAEVRGLLLELLAMSDIAGGRALELGCGTGALARTLADAGFDVLGLDISPVAIKYAIRLEHEPAIAGLSEGGPEPTGRGQCEFEVHDITLPRPELNGRFDVVLDGLALHCVTDAAARARTVGLARSALRPAGALLVMTVCGDPRHLPPGSIFDRATRRLMNQGTAEAYYATPAELDRLFAAEGLVPAYRRHLEGRDSIGGQDLYLAVLRPATTDAAPHPTEDSRELS